MINVRYVFQQVGNYHMGYMEEGDNRIAFMYRLVKGSAKRSFGLNVALLAKLPQEIVDRAAHMSKRLEGQVPFCLPFRNCIHACV